MDPRARLAPLKRFQPTIPGRLEVIEGDALKVDMASLVPEGPVRIVANLPYNVGTQLLLNWLEMDPLAPPSMNRSR